MKKGGFTYIEVVVAFSIFLVLLTIVIKLNAAGNQNMRIQLDRQKMMMEAQKLLEKYKTTKTDIGSYADDNYLHDNFVQTDGYYVVVQSKSLDTGMLYEVTVRVRKNITDKDNEIVLQGHVLKN